jgi:hyperosmotically inducible periplasmic protein
MSLRHSAAWIPTTLRIFRSVGPLVAIALLTMATAASAQGITDLQVADEIAKQVNSYTRYTIFDDVSAQVENGVVTLTGKVTMPYKKDDLGRQVAKIDGVREVQNQIDVLSVSPFDEELRYRIARAIYGNPSFWNYAAMANPPIHVIVDRGRVTLTGVVNSNVERMLARSLATGFGELEVVNDLRTDAEVRQQRFSYLSGTSSR